MPRPPQPHDSPACDWFAFWVVPASLPARADDAALFDWLTLPPEPRAEHTHGRGVVRGIDLGRLGCCEGGLPGPCCLVRLLDGGATASQPPACDCDAPCVVVARLPAFADEAALFD